MSDLVTQPTPAPRRLYPLRWHAEQERLKQSKTRFCTVPAGRRSGKTELLKRKVVKEAIKVQGWDDANFFLGAPTRDQAKAIYWTDLKAMFPAALVADVRESDLAVKLITGTTTYVIGMDKPERIEGRPWNGGGLDEYANMKPKTWGENVRPALSDRLGWCWLIGVPEGRNHYYELDQYAKSGVDDEWDSFSWPSADILPAKEIAAAKRQLDPLTFQQEYEASFINFVGRAYYPFDEKLHCAPLMYKDRADIGFCFDFNVDPGIACVVQEQQLPGQYERDVNGVMMLDRPIIGTGVIGEVWIPQNSNTPAVCRKLIEEWGDHQGRVVCFGDATGGARGSAKVQGSDWDLVKATLRPVFGDRLFMAVPAANPAERARVNAVNTRLLAGDGSIHMMVDPAEAPHVVLDLNGVRLLEGGSGEIDKRIEPKLTHISDGLGYYVVRDFPITGPARSSSFRM